jgi:peptide/nickel transport system permease protein
VIEFLSRRLVAALITLALATVVVFAVVEVLPGDPALVMLGTDARPDTLAALRARYGFDQPLLTRYVQWIGGLLTFDLGTSHAYGTSVGKLIGNRLVVTLPLGAMALGWAVLAAIPLGVFAAWKHGRPGDWGVMGFTQIGISIPNFWFGIVLVLLFAVTWQIFPAGGFPGWEQDVARSLHALVLPAVALSLGEIAILTRVTRSAMLDTLREDYVRTARAKGVPERTVLFRHALRNALIPVTTVAGLIAGFLIAGAVIIESVFRLPGVGQLVYDSINNRDLVVIKNVTILFTVMVLAVNLLVDLAYAVLDPRPRVRA